MGFRLNKNKNTAKDTDTFFIKRGKDDRSV